MLVKGCFRWSCGGRGIRTPERRVTPLTVFKTVAIGHSASPPTWGLRSPNRPSRPVRAHLSSGRRGPAGSRRRQFDTPTGGGWIGPRWPGLAGSGNRFRVVHGLSPGAVDADQLLLGVEAGPAGEADRARVQSAGRISHSAPTIRRLGSETSGARRWAGTRPAGSGPVPLDQPDPATAEVDRRARCHPRAERRRSHRGARNSTGGTSETMPASTAASSSLQR